MVIKGKLRLPPSESIILALFFLPEHADIALVEVSCRHVTVIDTKEVVVDTDVDVVDDTNINFGDLKC